MNTEAYQFTVYTMLIGMFIVFLAMILFSLIMLILDGAFRERRGEAAAAGLGAAGPLPRAAELPGWAMVAIAAYLTAEGEVRAGPSAEAWRPEVNHYDPWLAGGHHRRARVGSGGV